MATQITPQQAEEADRLARIVRPALGTPASEWTAKQRMSAWTMVSLLTGTVCPFGDAPQIVEKVLADYDFDTDADADVPAETGVVA